MSVDKTGFVLNTKVGFKLVERKEGRWKGKRGKSGKGREKERRKEVSGLLMCLPCGEDQGSIWEGFQVSKEAQ